MKISNKYSDFSDIFLEERALVLLKIMKLNQCAIKLRKNQQILYWSIYSLGPVKLKRLKTYIKINLIINFIWP